MAKHLEIATLPCDGATESVCPLCGDNLSASSIAGIIYADQQPLGCMCENCLGESPKDAAVRLRERADDLNEFIQRARQHLADEPWLACIKNVCSRADHWDKLANRIEFLDEWPVREEVCC